MITDRRAPNRRPATWLQSFNPIWWASDAERNPKWTWWKWFKRNPFCNFTMVIIGIAHCLRDCYHSKSPWTYADAGWNYGWSTKADSPFCPSFFHVPRPFVSYRGTGYTVKPFDFYTIKCSGFHISGIEWAVGWKTSGGFTCQCRRANSPNAEETP